MVFLRSINSPHLSGLSAKQFKILGWVMTAFVIWNGWYLISAPAQMVIKTKFPPNNNAIGYSIWLLIFLTWFSSSYGKYWFKFFTLLLAET